MIALTLVCGCLLLASVVVVLLAAIHAPEGYEDSQGFYEGIEPRIQKILAPGDARLVYAAAGLALRYADGLVSREDIEPRSREGLEPAERIQAAPGVPRHAQRTP
jgi:hypothetical protein